jgi:hypothetical protein
VVLEEQRGLIQCLPGYATGLSHIDAESDFQRFWMLQIDPKSTSGAHFAIKALELHGPIREVDETPVEMVTPVMSDEFDPWAVVDVR